MSCSECGDEMNESSVRALHRRSNCHCVWFTVEDGTIVWHVNNFTAIG